MNFPRDWLVVKPGFTCYNLANSLNRPGGLPLVVELKTMVQQISRVLVQKITKNEVNKILFF